MTQQPDANGPSRDDVPAEILDDKRRACDFS